MSLSRTNDPKRPFDEQQWLALEELYDFGIDLLRLFLVHEVARPRNDDLLQPTGEKLVHMLTLKLLKPLGAITGAMERQGRDRDRAPADTLLLLPKSRVLNGWVVVGAVVAESCLYHAGLAKGRLDAL